MKRPVRDERWTDSEGHEWQVAEVGKWRTGTRKVDGREVPAGRYTVAYVVMRNIEDERVRVDYAELLAEWKPVLTDDHKREGDPLDGHRAEIGKAVRNGKSRLTFEGDSPVKKGEIYHLACGEILIGKVSSKANKRSERFAEVEVVLKQEDKDYYLRRTVPGADPREIVKPPSADDIQKATIDGNYLSGAPEKDGDKLPVVPFDWVDRGSAERELRRQEQQMEVQVERQTQAAKSRLNRLLRNAKNPEDAQRLLAGIVALCEQAEASGQNRSA